MKKRMKKLASLLLISSLVMSMNVNAIIAADMDIVLWEEAEPVEEYQLEEDADSEDEDVDITFFEDDYDAEDEDDSADIEEIIFDSDELVQEEIDLDAELDLEEIASMEAVDAESTVVITSQPQNVVTAAGRKVAFSVKATGVGTLKYQWQIKRSTDIEFKNWSGKTTASISASATTSYQNMLVRCIITDNNGSVTTDTALVSFEGSDELGFVMQPQDAITKVGDKVAFEVVPQGIAPFTYQWQIKRTTDADFKNWSGKTASKVTATVTSAYEDMEVRCIVKDAEGQALASDVAVVQFEGNVKLGISLQPKDAITKPGFKVTFNTLPKGEGPFTYQWQIKRTTDADFKNWSGKVANTVTATATEAYKDMQVRCIIKDSKDDTIITNVALVQFEGEIELGVVTPPKSVETKIGEKVTFDILAKGNAPFTYQWQIKRTTDKDFINWSGKTANSVTATVVAAYQDMQVRCVVTDKDNNVVYSDPATITFEGTVQTKPLTITTQPKDIETTVGEKISFAVAAEGEGPFTYQWQVKRPTDADFKNWSGKTVAKIYVSTVATYENMQVRCLVTDANGKVVPSEAATITFAKLLDIVKQPADIAVKPGAAAEFTVEAQGDNLTYQWEKEVGGKFVPIDGATEATYSFEPIATDRGMKVHCVVSGGADPVVSEEAVLTFDAKLNVVTVMDKQSGTVLSTTEAETFTAKAGLPSGTVSKLPLGIYSVEDAAGTPINLEGIVEGSVGSASTVELFFYTTDDCVVYAK